MKRPSRNNRVEVRGDLVLIHLNGQRGGITLLDAADYPLVEPFNWSHHRAGYAVAAKAKKTVAMHQVLLPTTDFVDHVNRNRLDNRRENLRPATRSQNAANQSRVRHNPNSPYKGVIRDGSRWRARIRVEGVLISLGSYVSPELAAEAYDRAALNYFGEYAALNFPQEVGI